ncbi:glutathione S-transferase T1 [Capsicum annuum]
MTLKLYVDRMSQACREVIIFCKVNGIDFEEVRIDLSKRQQLSPEYREINPIQQIPAIVDGSFKLSESHAILRYLTCAYPGIADHCRVAQCTNGGSVEFPSLRSYTVKIEYPADLYKRAKVESMLDWHRTTFPRGPGSYFFYAVFASAVGRPLNAKAAARTEKNLIAALAKIESVWLQKKGRFLLGSNQPSIADLSLACEVMQLEGLDEKEHERILGPFKRVLKWLDDTKNAMAPHFEEVQSTVSKAKEKLQKQRNAAGSNTTQSGRKPVLHSKI